LVGLSTLGAAGDFIAIAKIDKVGDRTATIPARDGHRNVLQGGRTSIK
jgi:hypothetical protein